MWLFKKLFGGGRDTDTSDKASVSEPEDYKGFLIHPAPVKQAGGYRVGARIEKEVAGELRSHDLIRADVISDADEAEKMSLLKARQVIDEQGEALFH